jgi:hypothetical protein
MGELAGDMVEGRSCCLCGCFYDNPDEPDVFYEHGYPAVCWDCWSGLSKRERKAHQRAEVGTL